MNVDIWLGFLREEDSAVCDAGKVWWEFKPANTIVVVPIAGETMKQNYGVVDMCRVRFLLTLRDRWSTLTVSAYRSVTSVGDNPCVQGICRIKIVSITAAAGLWLLSASPAYAALVTVTSIVPFSDSASVTDSEGGTSTSNDGASLGSTTLDQFDASTGVLTGATINLSSTITQSVTVSALAAGKGSNSVTSDGSGSSTVNLTAPGASYTTSPAISVTGSCTGKRKLACSTTTTAAGVTTDQDIIVTSSLDSYVGDGTVSVDRMATVLNATKETDVFNGAETTEYALTWGG